MKAATQILIPTEILAEVQEAVDRATQGVRDPERMKRARQSMDHIREEIRKEHGVLDIGVSAIRALREE